MWDILGPQSALDAVLMLTLTSLMKPCSASIGDSSFEYRKCLSYVCLPSRCNHPSSNIRFYETQPLHLRLLGWDCESECRYDCMWETVKYWEKHDIQVQQFHGKWPFIRWMGMQEPASAIASVLNGVATIYMLRRFTRLFLPSSPFFRFWQLYGVVVANAWFWSFVFHVRDTEWTERFDYFSALSLILVQLYSCLVRIVGISDVRKPLVLGVALGLFFCHHCVTMSLVNFDYGYNMKVNLVFAAINVVTWVSFCAYKIKKGFGHFKIGLAAILMFALSGILETFEFSPVFWTFDSHSLFHFFTIPCPVLTFGFIIEDVRALLKEERAAKTTTTHHHHRHFALDVDEDPTTTMMNDNVDDDDDDDFDYDVDRRKAE